jgi:hypothetical protein
MIPEADTVDDVEGNKRSGVIANLILSGGVCGAGMHETAQPRNLGDPVCSFVVGVREGNQAHANDRQEVSLLHSTEETA